MKKMLFLLLLVAVKPAYSQQTSELLQPLDKMKLSGPFVEKTWRGYKQDDALHLITNVNDTSKRIQDNMPVVKLADKQIFLFNNGKGDNVYVSTVDNMRVLKPDATFISSMPVKK